MIGWLGQDVLFAVGAIGWLGQDVLFATEEAAHSSFIAVTTLINPHQMGRHLWDELIGQHGTCTDGD